MIVLKLIMMMWKRVSHFRIEVAPPSQFQLMNSSQRSREVKKSWLITRCLTLENSVVLRVFKARHLVVQMIIRKHVLDGLIARNRSATTVIRLEIILRIVQFRWSGNATTSLIPFKSWMSTITFFVRILLIAA